MERKKEYCKRALEYVETHHSPSDTSDCQAAMNIAVVKAFMAGAKWSDEHPSQQAMARELSRLGYTITMNGDIISKEEENEMVKNYVKYQKERLVEKACEWLEENMGTASVNAVNYSDVDFAASKLVGDKGKFIEQFRKAMEE